MNIPAKELKRQARSALMGRYTKPMTAYAITQLIVMGANFPFELMLKSNPTILQMVLSGLAAIIISFLSGVFICGQLFIHLNMARGKQAHRTDVFRFFTRRPDRIILSGMLITCMSLAVTIPAIAVSVFALRSDSMSYYISAVFIWIVTLIPLLVITYTYSLNNFLLIDRPDESIRDIFRLSRHMMRGKKGRLFYLNLSFFGMLLLCTLSLGIGLLWVIPYRNQTFTAFYLNLADEKGEAAL